LAELKAEKSSFVGMGIDFEEKAFYDILKAELRVDLIILLDANGYPPVTMDEVYKDVLEQAENFRKYAE
jgi:type I restriction enzyme R subunit